MSRALASAVLSALNSTAILVVSHSDSDDHVYVVRASTTRTIAIVETIPADVFGAESFQIVEMETGISYFPADTAEFKRVMESLNGYPTEADMRRNWSKPVYVVTDY